MMGNGVFLHFHLTGLFYSNVTCAKVLCSLIANSVLMFIKAEQQRALWEASIQHE